MEKEINISDLIGLSKSENMSDKIYRKISDLIMRGEIEEGFVFPNEVELCEQLGIGRSTLREAYKALELSGYITRTKRGTIVNNKTKILNATPLTVKIKNANKDDFIEFRRMIESEAVFYAAIRRTDKDIEDLKIIVKELHESRKKNDLSSMIDLDRKFHDRIAKMSKNSLFYSTMIATSDSWEESTRVNFIEASLNYPSKLDSMEEHHNKIIQAIIDKDPEKASQLMVNHINVVTAE